jgi:hypothetical protein
VCFPISAECAGVHRSTIYDWLHNDPAFQAQVAQARLEQADQLSGFFRDLAEAALEQLHHLMTHPDVPPAIRLRTCLAVLNRPTASTWSNHFPTLSQLPEDSAEADTSDTESAAVPTHDPTESDNSDISGIESAAVQTPDPTESDASDTSDTITAVADVPPLPDRAQPQSFDEFIASLPALPEDPLALGLNHQPGQGCRPSPKSPKS